jgi:hypothetical protein
LARSPAFSRRQLEGQIELDNQIFNWTLTGLLLVTGTYHAIGVIRTPGLVGKTNSALHTMMSLSMAAILWRQGHWITLGAVLLLTSGALWFIVQAVARPEFKSLCTGGKDRGRCIYHGITMVAGAYMATVMAKPVVAPSNMSAAAPTHAHHAASTIAPDATWGIDIGLALSGGAVLFFAAATLYFVVLIAAPSRLEASKTASKMTLNALFRPALGFEALGAGAMALMFLAMMP